MFISSRVCILQPIAVWFLISSELLRRGWFSVRVPQRPPRRDGKEGDGAAKLPNARTRGALMAGGDGCVGLVWCARLPVRLVSPRHLVGWPPCPPSSASARAGKATGPGTGKLAGGAELAGRPSG
jgi:hypothetical protein